MATKLISNEGLGPLRSHRNEAPVIDPGSDE